jgi:hypothetical protein
MWQIKTINESPNPAKPLNVSWKEFYLSFVKPIYYYGERVGYIYFDANLFNKVIQEIIPYIIQSNPQPRFIVFIDKQRNPMVIVKYPSLEIIVKDYNYDNIDKIVLIVNNEFIKEPKISRGRKPNPKVILKEEKTYQKLIIYEELTSGNPPIYGYFLDPENVRSYGDFINIITTEDESNFYIIDKTPYPGDARLARMPLSCRMMKMEQLYEILTVLGIQLPSNISREEICEIIKQRLKEIRHII